MKCSPSFGTGPIFRGRLDRPSILVLADQQSQDDLFTMRALTGDDGQHLQSFLRAAGITSRYAILRVLPVDTLADNQTAVAAVVDSARGPGDLRRGRAPVAATGAAVRRPALATIARPMSTPAGTAGRSR